MAKLFYSSAISIFILLSSVSFGDTYNRLLVLDFDCQGLDQQKSQLLGDSLRSYLSNSGINMASRSLLKQVMLRKSTSESDLNYRIEYLADIVSILGVDAAVYGQVYVSHGIVTAEMKLLEAGKSDPYFFDPFVYGSFNELIVNVPEIAYYIFAPDKETPYVISIEPEDGTSNLDQFIEMRIRFSEPMNPATYSITAKPDDMWKRYGDIRYDEASNTFIFKIHLYPNLDFTFSINDENAAGFKDLQGNSARKTSWNYSTKSK